MSRNLYAIMNIHYTPASSLKLTNYGLVEDDDDVERNLSKIKS